MIRGIWKKRRDGMSGEVGEMNFFLAVEDGRSEFGAQRRVSGCAEIPTTGCEGKKKAHRNAEGLPQTEPNSTSTNFEDENTVDLVDSKDADPVLALSGEVDVYTKHTRTSFLGRRTQEVEEAIVVGMSYYWRGEQSPAKVIMWRTEKGNSKQRGGEEVLFARKADGTTGVVGAC